MRQSVHEIERESVWMYEGEKKERGREREIRVQIGVSLSVNFHFNFVHRKWKQQFGERERLRVGLCKRGYMCVRKRKTEKERESKPLSRRCCCCCHPCLRHLFSSSLLLCLAPSQCTFHILIRQPFQHFFPHSKLLYLLPSHTKEKLVQIIISEATLRHSWLFVSAFVHYSTALNTCLNNCSFLTIPSYSLSLSLSHTHTHTQKKNFV